MSHWMKGLQVKIVKLFLDLKALMKLVFPVVVVVVAVVSLNNTRYITDE